MSFSSTFDFAFSAAVPSTPLVPRQYDVAIGGRPFMIDTDPNLPRDTFSHASVQYLTKYVTSPVFGSPSSISEVGESSLNPDVNWRRSSGGWHHGAGQQHLDLQESDRLRFNTSKGIDPWTVGKISLLPDTTSKRSSANTNLLLETAGDYLYVGDGSALLHTTDLSTFTDTGLTDPVTTLTSDGHSVWVAQTDGTYVTTRGASSCSLFNDLVPDLLAYRKGRLMAAKNNALFNITTSYLTGPPTNLALTVNGTAGTTTYGYRVSALNTAGETLACTEVTVTTGNATLDATNSITLTWDAVDGASSYKVYGRASGSELFIDTVSVTTYTDTGTGTPSGALPSADTTGSAPTALFTHDNSDWAWVGFASGDTCIYATGSSGDYSAVYRIPINANGTSLDAPIQAGELPKGETALTIGTYLGLVFVGTTVGLRMASQGTSGELQIGSALPVGPVRCLAGDQRFVWFGWENYDTTSTGLGRADITAINVDAPAYASDLMVTAQAHVNAVVTFGGKRVFTVSGEGVYQESDDLVTTGTLDSGQITFDLPDPKVAQAVDVRHSTPVVGSFAVGLALDGGDFDTLGTHTATSPDAAFTCSGSKGDVFEIRLTLGRDSTDNTAGPSVSRFTLMAIPAALSGEQISVPLLIRERLQPALGDAVARDCGDDVAYLTGLRKSKQSFIYQEAGVAFKCTMQDWQWLPSNPTSNRSAFEGTFVATMLHQDLQ